jgi:hypothetical protein
MTDDLFPRLRAVCDLDVAEMREGAGRHEYDGVVQDLSPDGVRAGLAALAEAAKTADPLDDVHDEAHLAAFEDHARISLGELELHRRNPLYHLFGLDLACYDRDYAPQAERDRARLAHLARWPQAVDAAIAALDQVSAPVAAALLDSVKGLAAGIPADAPEAVAGPARAAHERLVTAVTGMAASGDPDPALGGPALTALMSSSERMEVDLGGLAERADAERDRLRELLAASCARIDAGRSPMEVARELVRDHPGADGVIDAARHWTRRAIDFTRERDLVPYHDGECLVGLSPPSRRWGTAMMSWAAPGEPEGPSWYHITPPTHPGRSARRTNGWSCSARPRCPGSRCTRSRRGTSRTAGRSGTRPPRSAACCSRARSSRDGRTTPRRCASSRGSVAMTPGSRSGCGWRRWCG